MNDILVFLGGYIVGSIPTAFLLVRRKTGLDIRVAGSGNVGAFNAFDVTKSRGSGVLVGVLDGLKGFFVAGMLVWVIKAPFPLQAVGFFGAILGHNYPVWLRFKGGRGLATAAGGLFAIGLAYTIVWCVLWLIVYRIRKDIHTGNLAAILATPIILLAAPAAWIGWFMIGNATAESYQIFSLVLSGVVLLSHADVIRQFRLKRRLGE